jgi:hypothetical protein
MSDGVHDNLDPEVMREEGKERERDRKKERVKKCERESDKLAKECVVSRLDSWLFSKVFWDSIEELGGNVGVCGRSR